MSENIIISNWLDVEPRAKAGRFDQISIALHWLTVLLIIAQLATAWAASKGGGDTPALLTAHRSMGVLTWIVVVARLIWRHGFAYLPPFPASMSKLQQRAAKLNEYGLYGLLLIEPLTGVGSSLFRGRPFTLFAWQVPVVLAPDKMISHMFHSIHEFGVWALLALIGLHATAALFHGLILRDGVLQRMLPWSRAEARITRRSVQVIAVAASTDRPADCELDWQRHDAILHYETDAKSPIDRGSRQTLADENSDASAGI
jgi:cytochrome b561